ncbi:glycoside hydrolase family 76 protein [Pseudonocardia asaccharolytica]|uniref:Glycoside hydrolase n=1 Tax=Pseudonocardia asaccharolytica DSM 44247 = NBRC 16224 TaxID=1123024 RepID=A0A511D0S6_9PSEU|nr:glycoside hydrolase family 76 protein [Pseudonocardia asaccharolytica]GEL18405.1 glycoside hydrolase [Pseudonocardia asaccharolytica DSM 44247 = NBRC 16224]
MTRCWADRAALAERAVTHRHLRRLAGVLPGTRIGRVRWPRRMPAPLSPWHYWWQAHLLDCLVDAQLRAPTRQRDAAIAQLVRTVRLRNLGRWTNAYYDDVAWFGLAVQRAGARVGPSGRAALSAVTRQLRAGWTSDGGGGIWWRRGDDFKNAPANGPAAILLARGGQLGAAVEITDWMAATLVDPDIGLVRDGVRVHPDGSVRLVETAIYTYCQGVYLGACVELAERDGDPRWVRRAAAVLAAVAERIAGADGVIPGGTDAGDGGLFNGILARYLAEATLRRRELAADAGRLVLASAESVWANRAEAEGGPVFAEDWRRPARIPARDTPEADLSVQLSGWMLLEAAARLTVDQRR